MEFEDVGTARERSVCRVYGSRVIGQSRRTGVSITQLVDDVQSDIFERGRILARALEQRERCVMIVQLVGNCIDFGPIAHTG